MKKIASPTCDCKGAKKHGKKLKNEGCYFMYVVEPEEKDICPHCGHYVYWSKAKCAKHGKEFKHRDPKRYLEGYHIHDTAVKSVINDDGLKNYIFGD